MVEGKEQAIERFGLSSKALKLIREVFGRHPEVHTVKIFGSRAMGRFEDCSDVDLALWGDVDLRLMGRIVGELDELPLPYVFEVKVYETIEHLALRQSIDRFGQTLYRTDSDTLAIQENGDRP